MRRIVWAPAFLIWSLLGCHGKESDSGGSVTPPPPIPNVLACSDSAPQVDDVVMRCGARVGADAWEIDVVIGYPTTSTDIGGFAFDILIDPTVLTYVPGSARSGSMLFQDTVTPLLTADTAPGEPGRLVVGIYRTSGAPGVQGKTPPYDRIMVFRVKAVPGVQFDPDPAHLRFDTTRSQALDSSPSAQAITSIKFRDPSQILLSRQ